MIQVLDKNGFQCYTTDLSGDALFIHRAEELGLGLTTFQGRLITCSGSCIADWGNLSHADAPQDVKYVIELAARKYNYLDPQIPFCIKHFKVIGDVVIFTELDLGLV